MHFRVAYCGVLKAQIFAPWNFKVAKADLGLEHEPIHAPWRFMLQLFFDYQKYNYLT